MVDQSTKERILETAHKLFAIKGLTGVSVREIAKETGVNIAAINYHFKNKENLYNETIRSCMLEAEKDIKEIFNSPSIKSTEDFSLAVFRYFLEDSEGLRTTFKLILSTDHYTKSTDEEANCFKEPPGSEYFYRSLEQEHKSSSSEDIEWASQTIYTHLMHSAIILSSKAINLSLETAGIGIKKFENDLKRLINIVKKEIN